jgi:tetratricopeptide (TPR) repeat protein
LDVTTSIDIESEEYAAALNNLSLSYARRHRTIEALPYMKRAIALKRKLFGERHPGYLGNLEDMSMMLAELGHEAEAVPYFAEICDILSDQLGQDDPKLLGPLQNLALALHTPQEVRHARARTPVNPVELSCRLFKLTRLCVEVSALPKSIESGKISLKRAAIR